MGEGRPFSAPSVAVFAGGAWRIVLGVKGSPVRIRQPDHGYVDLKIAIAAGQSRLRPQCL